MKTYFLRTIFIVVCLGLACSSAWTQNQNKTQAYYNSHEREILPDARAAFKSGDYERTVELCRWYYIIVGDRAADSLRDQARLLLMACQTKARFFSSMGAALKLDPTRIQVAEFWKVTGDPLARALRNRFKRDKTFPKRKFKCVFSDELLQNQGQCATCGTEQCVCPKAKAGPGNPRLLNHEWCSSKAQINGTLAHITAIFGFTLAGLVVQDIVEDASVKNEKKIKTE